MFPLSSQTYCIFQNKRRTMFASCLLFVWMGFLSVTSTSAMGEEKKVYGNESILTNIPLNMTKLNMSYNNLDFENLQNLKNYTNLKELYLSNNSIKHLPGHGFDALSQLRVLNISNNIISVIEPKAFKGLDNLEELNLSHNQIESLDAEDFVNLSRLRYLSLQGNKIQFLNEGVIKSLNRTGLNVNLADNPWNCTCRLLMQLNYLKTSEQKMENKNKTICASPNELKGKRIWTLLNNATLCSSAPTTRPENPAPTTTPSTTKSAHISSTFTGTKNKTGAKMDYTEAPQSFGDSWHFLLGVVVTALSTSVLIVCAVKFPTWHKLIFSYRHQRLRDEEPEIFTTSHFTMDQAPQGHHTQDQHVATDDEDGFIEDQYIESLEQ
ncbi:leucine-rich repeat-containing protein 19 isoform X1 [Amia ocellicauda]|uniref:leucine-rich repeat-containing protein 19 isoform X1 n=1 Tax=Amia ocellicauda TaxID=2972642 RepID=UPI003464134D